jgi:hypothetical protein
MKKTVLTFGLISGALSSLMMVATVPFEDKIGFDKGEFVGYTIIVLSFLLVFFGIRSYRDNVGRRPDHVHQSVCRRHLHYSDFVHLLCRDVGSSLLHRPARFHGQIRRLYGR